MVSEEAENEAGTTSSQEAPLDPESGPHSYYPATFINYMERNAKYSDQVLDSRPFLRRPGQAC